MAELTSKAKELSKEECERLREVGVAWVTELDFERLLDTNESLRAANDALRARLEAAERERDQQRRRAESAEVELDGACADEQKQRARVRELEEALRSASVKLSGIDDDYGRGLEIRRVREAIGAVLAKMGGG